MNVSRRTLLTVAVLVMAIVMALPVVAGGGQARPAAAGEPYIAVVSKGEQHDFWQQVRRGANDAATQFGIRISYEGPPSESDVAIQVQMLNSAIAQRPIAVALASLDTNAVMDQLVSLQSQGIPVVGFDSGVPNAPAGSIVANASTNNAAAAGLGAENMFNALRTQIEAATPARPVRIVVLNQDNRGESLLSRGRGFRDRMVELVINQTSKTAANIRVMGDPAFVDARNPQNANASVIIEMVVPASASATDSTAASQAVMSRAASDNIRGIFMSNEGTVGGLLSATNDGSDLQGTGIVAVGFDAGRAQKNAVRRGYFLGSVTQDPYQIGFQAVRLALEASRGNPVSDVDTGAKFYTAANMDQADIAPLLYD
jgi:ribose transport system substrate-binding protein